MELAIALLVIVGGVWFFFFRNKEEVKESLNEAPKYDADTAAYKLETPSEPVVSPVTEATPVAEVKVEATEQKTEVPEPVKKRSGTQSKAKAQPKAKAAPKTRTSSKKPRMKVVKTTK